MSKLSEVATRLEEAASSSRVAPGFEERIAVAASFPDGAGRARSIRAPYYLTDLGVRRFEDPSVFFLAHLESLGLASIKSEFDAALVDDAANCDIRDYGSLADRYILLVGDYDHAEQVLGDAYLAVSQSTSFNSQLQLGVLALSVGDGQGLALLDKAACSERVDYADKFMVTVRAAAALAKRLGRRSEALARLQAADDELEVLVSAGDVSDRDAALMRDVSANLAALVSVMQGDPDGAIARLAQADRPEPTVGDGQLTSSQGNRYKAQRSINYATVLFREQRYDVAVACLERNLEFTRRYAPDYEGEAQSTLTYGLLLAERYEDCVLSAEKAIALVSQEASPARLKKVRSVLLACYVKMGRLSAAKEVSDLMEHDPLGLSVGSRT